LVEGDAPVRLGSRAFEILTCLVERAGEVITKEELISRAWPQTVIEEANLKIQVSALRRALGDGQGGRRYIVTVPGRGYNFVAPVRLETPPARALDVVSVNGNNLPVAVTRVIGRDEVVATIVAELSRQRLVTIVGPGGVGKTTVALAIAEHMISDYEHGVWLIDLAPLRDPGLVPGAVATALGLRIRTGDPLTALAAALRESRILLLLDNCEHVIDAAATLAATVLSRTSGVKILATSREPLGVRGERVHRLGTLNSPGPSSKLTAAEAGTFPAVQLFVERVSEIVEDFVLTDANARLVIAICRRLDGLPLAIEFAAPRVEVFGIEGLATRLDDSLRTLTAQRRGAVPRHQTMQGVVDWSYNLLSQDEQRFLRGLGIFTGSFTSEAAAAVAVDVATAGGDAIDRLADLVGKSLVVADVSGSKPRFRLLDTTRLFALEKLDSSGERQPIAQRHAEYYRHLLQSAEAESAARPADEWCADYAGEIDNLRAALDWAFSPGGAESIGMELTVAAIPVWLQSSMVDECRGRVEQALASLARGVPIDSHGEMKLRAALGASLLFTRGAVPAARQASTAALRLAESLGDTEHQLRVLWELWVHHTNTGEHGFALAVAQRFYTLALEHADPTAVPIADRMMGLSHHYSGDQASAWRHVERMLSADVTPQRRSTLIRFWFDQNVASRVALARILWLRGFADQAWRIAQSAVGDAEVLADSATLCYALSHGGCLIALWVGDFAAAAYYADMLLDHSRKHGFAVWNDFASRLKGVVLVKAGDLGGSPLLGAALDEITDPCSGLWFLTGLGEMAEALGRVGRFTDASEIVARGIDQSQTGWLAPELLRIKGELLSSQGTTGTTEAVADIFQQALRDARKQGCPSWELRAATSLARLRCNQGRPADAAACLRPIYDRFTEGFDTADLVAARRLLDGPGAAGYR
jgi:predicted ATPase/DNA-binding winged helix-turn-helix (wHTH) protein